MINHFSNTICLVVVAVFLVAGCQQERGKSQIANRKTMISDKRQAICGKLLDPNFIVPDYASRAIEAAGGRQAWTEAELLRLDCVVTFYKSDGSFYLTEHHYEIYPWSNSIRISATEPQGKVVWELSRRGLEGRESWNTGIALPIEFENRHFAEAILDITTAPVRFLDKPVVFTKDSRPVKREGLWYHSIERVNPDKIGIFSYAVFYQNRNTSLVDIIWFAGVDSFVIASPARWKRAGASEAQRSLLALSEVEGVAIPISLAVRGYDYRELEKGGVRVPAKIEIFRTNAAGVLQERLVKIDSK